MGELAAVFLDGDAGGFDGQVFQAGEGFVHRHVVARGVAVDVFDVPALFIHPAAAFHDADDRGGGGGVAVGIPAEVESGAERFDEIVVAVDDGGDDAAGVELVTIFFADDAALCLPASFHGGASFFPIVWVVVAPFADGDDDIGNFAVRIDGSESGVEDFLDVVFDERGGDHRGEELRGLGRFAVDGDACVVEAEPGGGLRHGGRHQAEGFAHELARDVEVGPGVQADVAGPGRLDAEVHEIAGVTIGAEDAPIDVPLPERRDASGRQHVVSAAGDFAEVHPFDIGVVVGDGAFGKRRRVMFNLSRMIDVFEFVRQAVEVADDLGQHAAADFVVEFVGGDFEEARSIGVKGDGHILFRRLRKMSQSRDWLREDASVR